MSLTAGTRLGPYEVVSPLGAGGMGEVYKARDTRLDRLVALKILAPALASDAEFKSRFAREARAISGLKHPHICVLYDIGSHRDIDYLVLEHLEGQTLAERLRDEPRGLKLPDALGIALGVADALAAAHSHGIVHRDLKPGNIMLTAGGPKLLDFGLAKEGLGSAAAVADLPTLAATATGQGVIVGTLQYMAPEQAEGRPVDARTDLFALGAVIYEMVTGRKAFEAQTQASLIANVLQVDPPAVSTVVATSPPALDRLVRRCLAKEPENRWQSARDVFLELRWILEESEKPPALTRQAATWRQWLPWAMTALVALLALSTRALLPNRTEATQPLSRFDIPLPPRVLPLALSQGTPALSPDGRFVAVSATMDGRLQVLLRRLDQTAFIPLPGTDNGRVPFWSPDSRSVAFFAGQKLQRVAISGGPVVSICDVTGTLFSGGSWNRHGVIVFEMGGAIYRVAESGGTAVAVTSLDAAPGETAHRFPQFLDDGRSFLFSAIGPRTEIRAGTLDSPVTKLVVADATQAVFAPPASLLVLRGQSVLAAPFDAERVEVTGTERSIFDQVAGGLSASRNGTLLFRPAGLRITQLQRFTRDGRRLGGLGSAGPYQQLALSPNGTRVALQRGEFTSLGIGTSNIWILDLTTGIQWKLTTDPRYEADPSWSADERSLAFSIGAAGGKGPNLFRKDLATGIEEPLADIRGSLDEWTPDGRFAIFRRDGRTIVAVPLAGDRTPRTIVDRPLVIHDQPHVSPDGRWIAFNSNESGRWEVHVARFPDFTDKHQISKDGGVQPLWRRDSEELFYLDLRGQVMGVAVTTETPNPFGVPHPLFSTALNPSPFVGEYAVTADGQRFFAIEPAEGAPAAFTFVLNWRPD